MEKEEREVTTRVSERGAQRDKDASRSAREVQEAGLNVVDASCRLLSNFLFDIGDALAPRRRRVRYYEEEQEEPSERTEKEADRASSGVCDEFGFNCRTFSRADPQSRRSSKDDRERSSRD